MNVVWAAATLYSSRPIDHAPDMPHRAFGRRSRSGDPRRPRHQRLLDGGRQDRRRNVYDLDGHGVLRRESRRRHADADFGHQQTRLRQYQNGRGAETLGQDHRRQTDADVGNPAARLRSRQKYAALLSGRSAERRFAVLELPLEFPADGGAGLRRRCAQPPRPALVRTGVARRFRATIRARTSATTSRPSTTWRKTGPTKNRGMRRRFVRRLFGLFFSPDATRNGSKPLSRAASSTSSRCTAQTEELFFINNDYGGPYWDRSNTVAQRILRQFAAQIRREMGHAMLIFTGEYDFRIPTRSRSKRSPPPASAESSAVWWNSKQAHQVFKPRTRSYGTASSSAAEQIRKITVRKARYEGRPNRRAAFIVQAHPFALS